MTINERGGKETTQKKGKAFLLQEDSRVGRNSGDWVSSNGLGKRSWDGSGTIPPIALRGGLGHRAAGEFGSERGMWAGTPTLGGGPLASSEGCFGPYRTLARRITKGCPVNSVNEIPSLQKKMTVVFTTTSGLIFARVPKSPDSERVTRNHRNRGSEKYHSPWKAKKRGAEQGQKIQSLSRGFLS